MEFREPIRKHGSYHLKDWPVLPILSETNTSRTVDENYWPVFTGCFNGVSVVVGLDEEMEILHNMGVFGKGSLSKSYPSFGKKKKGIPPLITSSKWERRLKWMDAIEAHIESSKKIIEQNCTDIENNEKEMPNAERKRSNKFDQINCQPSTSADIRISVCDSNSSAEEQAERTGNASSQESEGDGIIVTIDDSDEEMGNANPMKPAQKRAHCNDDLAQGDTATPSKKQKDEPVLGHYDGVNNNSTYDTVSLASTESAVIVVSSGNQEETTKGDIQDLDSSIAVIDSIRKNVESDLVKTEVVVINKLGLNNEVTLEQLNPRLEYERIKTVQEVLHLMLEEAFFLSYGLGCLQVIDVTGQFLSIIGMWNLYRTSQADFVEKYVSYHHFKSKGWVVKSGLKFGGDFILYKKSPSIFHASYIVIVELIIHKTGSIKVSNHSIRSPGILKSFTRMAENCNKEIIMCEVHSPCPMEEITTPESLKKIKVNECLVRRWQPAHHRDAD